MIELCDVLSFIAIYKLEVLLIDGFNDASLD